MSEHDSEDRKKQLITDINGFRISVNKNERIHLRAQDDLFNELNQIVEDINKDSSDASLFKATSKLNILQKRASQAESKGQFLLWMPIGIGIYLVMLFGLIAWAMFNYKQTLFAETPVWYEVVLGAVLLGALGASADCLRELHKRVARQELELIRLAWYLSHPVIGAALGVILFFVVYAGLLALTTDEGNYNPALIYALSALAGFSQQQVIQYLKKTLADILNIKREPPEEAG